MSRKIRAARAGAKEGISRVLHDVWEESLLEDVFEAYTESDDRLVLVSEDGGQVEGFSSAFLTPAPVSCWEVDLVAVLPNSRGKGVGSDLIRGTVSGAPREKAEIARASVRVDNCASQGAFERVGFSTDMIERTLLLWDPVIGCDESFYHPGVALVPVDTLTYRGLWIEVREHESDGSMIRAAINACRSRIAKEGRLNTGALVSDSQQIRLHPELRDGREHGRYHRWTMMLRDNQTI